MSPEPKPRSMAAVTITVNSRGYRPVAVIKSGYMLEHPSISQYAGLGQRKNLRSADNQQERPRSQLQSESWNPQRPYARPPGAGG